MSISGVLGKWNLSRIRLSCTPPEEVYDGLATLFSILKNPQWRMRLEWDDGEYEGPVTLVSISNGPVTGGIFYTVPHADPFDGKLSFVYGHIGSRLKILQVLPKIMNPDEGNYTEHPSVHEHHSTWLKVHIENGSPAHTDGELFALNIQDAEYRIHPRFAVRL